MDSPNFRKIKIVQVTCFNLLCHVKFMLQAFNAVCAVHNSSPYLVIIVTLN